MCTNKNNITVAINTVCAISMYNDSTVLVENDSTVSINSNCNVSINSNCNVSIDENSTISIDICSFRSNKWHYNMPTAHSLLWLVRSWSHDHLTKLIFGCNITFQHFPTGSCAQFSTWTFEKEPNISKLRQGTQKSLGFL